MAQRFLRSIRIIVGDGNEALKIENLFISFNIRREGSKTPAEGKIEIYNLNESNETRIRERGKRLQLFAGYGSDLNLIADGDVRRVERMRQRLDRVTRIQFGGNVTRRTQNIFNPMYENKVPIRQIVTDAVAAMGLDLGPLDAIPDEEYPEVFTWERGAESALRLILLPHKIEHYEENGVIRFSVQGKSQDDRDAIVISEKTGMIGTPTTTDDGMRVRTLLDPRLLIDSRVRIESASLENERAEEQKGVYKVSVVEHMGDNREGDFFTDIELKHLN